MLAIKFFPRLEKDRGNQNDQQTIYHAQSNRPHQHGHLRKLWIFRSHEAAECKWQTEQQLFARILAVYESIICRRSSCDLFRYPEQFQFSYAQFSNDLLNLLNNRLTIERNGIVSPCGPVDVSPWI